MTAALSPWALKRTGNLNGFYTRPTVGNLLIRELGAADPKAVVDLGAGEGSLSAAVVRQWPNAFISTVDVNPTCAAPLSATLTAAGATAHRHLTGDVLNPELVEELGTGAFDVAVCNPPFFRPEWKREFAYILQAASLEEACPKTKDVSAEILFLAQSLRLLRDGGTAALIVPNGLATGYGASAFRRALLRTQTLRTVIELPPYSFLDTEAYCFILIIDKAPAGPSHTVKLIKVEGSNCISAPLMVASGSVEIRLDYDYHRLQVEHCGGRTTLRDLGADVRRGSISTVDRKRTSRFVFHTGDFPSEAACLAFGSELPEHSGRQLVVAQPGDILLARVDRQLHEKVAFVESGRAAITDCVYRIRLPKRFQQATFQALSSPDGRKRMQSAMKGVGARLLGKGDLLDLPLAMVFNAVENIDLETLAPLSSELRLQPAG